ncbi:hypothetical protein M8J75_016342 [Diaphorina citri]|nr:hypothetical protein M8J75_016342 [Diaphorina citri]KAI5744175.1 hypothetical protein M8J77_026409 [Diaphorina citri]KAI5750907.1 hypothetical protein M8J77_002357 [Diaphorina citri]
MKTYNLCFSGSVSRGNIGGSKSCESAGSRKNTPIIISQCQTASQHCRPKSQQTCPASKKCNKRYKFNCKLQPSCNPCEKPTYCCQCNSESESEDSDYCCVLKQKGKNCPVQILCKKRKKDSCCSSDDSCNDSDSCSSEEESCCCKPDPNCIYIVFKQDKKKRSRGKKKMNLKIVNC